MRASDREGCHVIPLSEYEAAVESSAPQPEVIRVITEWLRVLRKNQRKNVLTLCTACDGPVNGDVGGFIIFEPRVLTLIGVTICLCSRCFAEDDTREGVMRWVEGAAAKAKASVRRGR